MSLWRLRIRCLKPDGRSGEPSCCAGGCFRETASPSPPRQVFGVELRRCTTGISGSHKTHIVGTGRSGWSVRSLVSLRHLSQILSTTLHMVRLVSDTHLSIQSHPSAHGESEDCRRGSILKLCHNSDTSVAERNLGAAYGRPNCSLSIPVACIQAAAAVVRWGQSVAVGCRRRTVASDC